MSPIKFEISPASITYNDLTNRGGEVFIPTNHEFKIEYCFMTKPIDGRSINLSVYSRNGKQTKLKGLGYQMKPNT